MKNILTKIKDAKLVGRGGAGFPSHIKWQAVKNAKAKQKYVICNASEGELGIFKDIFILKHYPERLFKGLIIAMDFIGTKNAYFNFNLNYYHQVQEQIESLIKKYQTKGYQFEVFKETPSYPGGEETALLNAIEGKRLQPRLKPPYPTEKGLFGKPTLVHNVETLYNVADVADDKFEGKRFYCISGICKNHGVFHLPDNWTIFQVLKETDNLPEFDFFVQVGGSASGLVFNQAQAETEKVTGAGAIEIYRLDMHPQDLLLKWFEFYNNQSCGKCTPCREGTFQLWKLVKQSKEIPWQKIEEILTVLAETSFCALGKSVPVPVKSYLQNVLKLD